VCDGDDDDMSVCVMMMMCVCVMMMMMLMILPPRVLSLLSPVFTSYTSSTIEDQGKTMSQDISLENVYKQFGRYVPLL